MTVPKIGRIIFRKKNKMKGVDEIFDSFKTFFVLSNTLFGELLIAEIII
jgi:hypothetical protein